MTPRIAKTQRIAATLLLLLPPSTMHSDDSVTPMTLPIVVTLLLLLPPSTLHSDDIADGSDSAFAAKKICSKRWSHCPETIVSKGTGTLSVAVDKDLKGNDRDVDRRRFSVFDLKDLVTLKTLRTLLRVAEG